MRTPYAALAELAMQGPQRAPRIACHKSAAHIRQALTTAELRNWALTDPRGAANWSLSRPFAERGADVSAVLEGAIANRVLAIEIAKQMIQADPTLALDHGYSLIFALKNVSDFAAAIRFAQETESPDRDAWLEAAFNLWAEQAPSEAATRALALPDQQQRQSALKNIAVRWAAADPRAALAFAQSMPATEERQFALRAALSEWARQAPAEASEWINQQPASSEMDDGIIAVATMPELISSRPEVALEWARSVSNPDLRSHTETKILTTLASIAPEGVERLVAVETTLTATDQQMLLSSIQQRLGDEKASAQDARTSPSNRSD